MTPGAHAALHNQLGCQCVEQVFGNFDPVEDGLCDIPCPEGSGGSVDHSTQFCGGGDAYFSVFKEYDLCDIGQGTLDPWRSVWYQCVALRSDVDIEGANANTADLERSMAPKLDWYLHAINVTTGLPLFGYQQRLPQMLHGLHYDLDQSRLVGQTTPYWIDRETWENWTQSLLVMQVNSSVAHDIVWNHTEIELKFAEEDNTYLQNLTQHHLMASVTTALDSVNNIYYISVPDVPQNAFDGVFAAADYKSRIFGVRFDAPDTQDERRIFLLSDAMGGVRVMNLQTNQRFEDSSLKAMVMEGGTFVGDKHRVRDRWAFVELGAGSRNKTTGDASFEWVFNGNINNMFTSTADCNQTDNGNENKESNETNCSESDETATEYFYQANGGTSEHYEETSFFVGKEFPDVSESFRVVDVRHSENRSPWPTDWSPLWIPGMQSAALMNLDPVVPWLPPPKVHSIRFSMDAFSIVMVFEHNTSGGVTYIDTDGDTLPDLTDWSTQQIGDRNCSDMFATDTALQAGSAPDTVCRWNGDVLTMYLPNVDIFFLHDPIELRNNTISRYLSSPLRLSRPAFGLYNIDYPYPLLDPVTIVRSFAKHPDRPQGIITQSRMTGPNSEPFEGRGAPVSLCEGAWMSSEESFHHGGLPRWQWNLEDVVCESIGGYIFDPELGRLADVRFQLANSSMGLEWVPNGTDLVTLPREILEPGCVYFLSLSVWTRWNTRQTVRWKLNKLNPIGAMTWVPDCTWMCNTATCEEPSRCGSDGLCICAEGFWGLFCAGICPPCSRLGTKRCDDGRLGKGKCICRPGFYGTLCNQRTEWRETGWTECDGLCNMPSGKRRMQYGCFNVETDDRVDGMCFGQPEMRIEQCLPPPCPCGAPPQIEFGENDAILAECPQPLPSGGICYPICKRPYVETGIFRCQGGEYVEVPLCAEVGEQKNEIEVLSLKVSLGGFPLIAADDPTLYMIESGLMANLKASLIEELSGGPNRLTEDDIEITATAVIEERRRLEDEISFSFSNSTLGRGTQERVNSLGVDLDSQRIADDFPNFAFEPDFNKRPHATKGGSRQTFVHSDPARGRRLESVSLDLTVKIRVPESVDIDEVEGGLIEVANEPAKFYETLTRNIRVNCPKERQPCDSPGTIGISPPIRTKVFLPVTTTTLPILDDTRMHQGFNRDGQIYSNDFKAGLAVGLVLGCGVLCCIGCAAACCCIKKRRKVARVAPVFEKPSAVRLPSMADLQSQWEKSVKTSARECEANAVAMPALPREPADLQDIDTMAMIQDSIASTGAAQEHKVETGIGDVCRHPANVENAGKRRHIKADRGALADIGMDPLRASDLENREDEPVLFTGHTIQEWQDGGRYKGQVIGGLREGEGLMTWPSGKSYVGQWRAGKFDGHGVLHTASQRGCRYNGQFKNGQCHGLGRCEWPSRGTWYDGEWVNGVQQGLGESGSLCEKSGSLADASRVTAHICKMANGRREENLAVSRVIPDRHTLTCAELIANSGDLARSNSAYGSSLGELQLLATLWGIVIGRPDEWIPGRFGAVIITRILPLGTLDRWMQSAKNTKKEAILPNAVIWTVNGVSGDVQLMTRELTTSSSDKLVLEFSNPPSSRFDGLRERMARRRKHRRENRDNFPTSPSSPNRPWLNKPDSNGQLDRQSTLSVSAAVPPPPPRQVKLAQNPSPAQPPPLMQLAQQSDSQISAELPRLPRPRDGPMETNMLLRDSAVAALPLPPPVPAAGTSPGHVHGLRPPPNPPPRPPNKASRASASRTNVRVITGAATAQPQSSPSDSSAGKARQPGRNEIDLPSNLWTPPVPPSRVPESEKADLPPPPPMKALPSKHPGPRSPSSTPGSVRRYT